MTLENKDEMILGKIKEIFNLTKKIEDSNYYDLELSAIIEHEIETVRKDLLTNLACLRHAYAH